MSIITNPSKIIDAIRDGEPSDPQHFIDVVETAVDSQQRAATAETAATAAQIAAERAQEAAEQQAIVGGTPVFVNGALQGRVDFSSDPQTQINNKANASGTMFVHNIKIVCDTGTDSNQNERNRGWGSATIITVNNSITNYTTLLAWLTANGFTSVTNPYFISGVSTNWFGISPSARHALTGIWASGGAIYVRGDNTGAAITYDIRDQLNHIVVNTRTIKLGNLSIT